MSDLNSKCEQALVAFTQAANIGLDDKWILPGKGSVDKSDPCFIWKCTGTDEEFPPYTGNYWVEAKGYMLHTAVLNPEGTAPTDDPKTDDDAILAAAFTAISIDDLPAQLSPLVDGFACQAVVFLPAASEEDENGFWRTVLNLKLLCCVDDLDDPELPEVDAPQESDWTWAQSPGDLFGLAALSISLPAGVIGWQLYAPEPNAEDYAFANESFSNDPLGFSPETPPVDGTNVFGRVRWIIDGGGNSDPETVYSDFSEAKFFVWVNP